MTRGTNSGRELEFIVQPSGCWVRLPQAKACTTSPEAGWFRKIPTATALVLQAGLLLLFGFGALNLPAQETVGRTNNFVVTIEAGGTTNTVIVPARLWKNFYVLMADAAAPLAKAVARLAVFTVLAGIAGFLSGAMLGFALWHWLRRRGLFDAPYNWHRYFKWMWAPLFPMCAALGLAYAAAWLQAGHLAKGAITRDRLVERAVASAYAAVALDTAKHELTGREPMAEVQKILSESDDLSQILNTNLGALLLKNFQAPEVQQALGIPEFSWLKRIAESQAGRLALQHAADNADGRLILLTFYAIASGNQACEDYLKANPKAGPAAVVAREYLQRVNRELVRLINGFVYPHVVLATLAGLGLPLLLAGLFRLAARRGGAATSK